MFPKQLIEFQEECRADLAEFKKKYDSNAPFIPKDIYDKYHYIINLIHKFFQIYGVEGLYRTDELTEDEILKTKEGKEVIRDTFRPEIHKEREEINEKIRDYLNTLEII